MFVAKKAVQLQTADPSHTGIPVSLSKETFDFVGAPYLSKPKRGPQCKIGYWKVFNYILVVLYTGMQWKALKIDTNADGQPEIHYTTIYKCFARWADDGSLMHFFENSIKLLHHARRVDLSGVNGDATNTVAKKGGDGIGYSGHKHQKGEKIMAIVDQNGSILAPCPIAAVNVNDCVLLPKSLDELMRITRLLGESLEGAYMNLDGAFDSKNNRKLLQNRGLVPNIPENKRNRKAPKPGPKRWFDPVIHKCRLAVERTFAWEDKFRRLLLRFERIQSRHYGLKLLAYALINLRVFFQA